MAFSSPPENDFGITSAFSVVFIGKMEILCYFCMLNHLTNIMNKISHQGFVESVEGDSALVRIVQTSACAACKAASHCSAAESKEKLVNARIMGNTIPKVGDSVVVSMSGDNGRDAVIYAFVLPFIIMVVVLYCCLRISSDEALAALVGIGSLVPYYLVLYLLRGKLRRKFLFVLEDGASI